MKFCPYCGADLVEDGVSFCVECGKQLPAGKTQKESRRAVSKSKRSWMMDMMDIMTISIRLTKDMSVKA